MDCRYRTSDGEKECEFQNRIIQVPDEWQGVRIQASIAAMQGFLSRETYGADLTTLAKDSVRLANYLIEELKKNNYDKRRIIGFPYKGGSEV